MLEAVLYQSIGADHRKIDAHGSSTSLLRHTQAPFFDTIVRVIRFYMPTETRFGTKSHRRSHAAHTHTERTHWTSQTHSQEMLFPAYVSVFIVFELEWKKELAWAVRATSSCRERLSSCEQDILTSNERPCTTHSAREYSCAEYINFLFRKCATYHFHWLQFVERLLRI